MNESNGQKNEGRRRRRKNWFEIQLEEGKRRVGASQPQALSWVMSSLV